jgi:hypothetical protein
VPAPPAPVSTYLGEILDEEATVRAGPKGVHYGPDWGPCATAPRAAWPPWAWRRALNRLPRLPSADRTSELASPRYRASTSTELLGWEALVRVIKWTVGMT